MFLSMFVAMFSVQVQIGKANEFDDPDIDQETFTEEQLQQLHTKFDMDNNGKASFSELMLHAEQAAKRIAAIDIAVMLQEIDKSQDGLVSLEEHLTDIVNQADGGDDEEIRELAERKILEEAKFHASDVNHDGVLDRFELPALFYPEIHDPVLQITVRQSLKQKDTNSDGKLSPHEFWEADPADADEGELSEEEFEDFATLDTDHDGHIDVNELKHWESGSFHTGEAMKRLFEIADKDNDMFLTASELSAAREAIAVSDAQYHFMEWVEHYEL